MDYWGAAKQNIFVDAKKLLHDLKTFDKDNIPDKVIQKIQPYVKMPEFTPKAIEKASSTSPWERSPRIWIRISSPACPSTTS